MCCWACEPALSVLCFPHLTCNRDDSARWPLSLQIALTAPFSLFALKSSVTCCFSSTGSWQPVNIPGTVVSAFASLKTHSHGLEHLPCSCSVGAGSLWPSQFLWLPEVAATQSVWISPAVQLHFPKGGYTK